MENLFKKIIIISAIGILVYASSIFFINQQKDKKVKSNILVALAIHNKDFQDEKKMNQLIESIDDGSSSLNSIKLLQANKLIEENLYDKSLTILSTIKNIESDITRELVFSLKAIAYANKGMCDESKESFRKIIKYKSIKEISIIETKNCIKEAGGK